MADQVLLYISAAPDLEQERQALGRAVADIPVSLGWRIVQSPRRDEPADLEAVAQADVHLLLLGSDIRAPIGQEWLVARRAGRQPALFIKQQVLRTPAAYDFLHYVAEQAAWQPFTGVAGLRQQVLRLLANHLIQHTAHYALFPADVARLQAWQADLAAAAPGLDEGGRGTGDSGLILSPERYVPSDGILLRPGSERPVSPRRPQDR